MDYRALVKFQSRLRNADNAVRRMREAATYQQYSDAWSSFLTSWKGVYECLKNGVVNETDKAWFDQKVIDREADHLLRYLYAARNDDEHGLDPVIAENGGEFLVQLPPEVPGVERSVMFSPDPITGEVRYLDQDGNCLDIIGSNMGYGALRRVKPHKNKEEIHPPISHLGNVLEDLSPHAIAQIALLYLEHLFHGAKQLNG